MTEQNLGIVIVTFGNEKTISRLLKKIISEKEDKDYLIVVDNHPNHLCADIADDIRGVDDVIRSDNVGFGNSCNNAAAKLPERINNILFLNPDVIPDKNAISKLRLGAKQNYGAWMGLLLLPNNKINSAGNVIHISGLSWCDNYGQVAKNLKVSAEVKSLSGACLFIKRNIFNEVDGFTDGYFMYYEDTDLSVKIKKAGYSLGIITDAVFVHDYIFDKGENKWFYLERNRYIFILLQWPLSVIVILSPLLLFFELGFWINSILSGRFMLRIRAVSSFIKNFKYFYKHRVNNNLKFKINGKSFMKFLQPEINTPLIGDYGVRKLFNKILRLYYQTSYFLISVI